MTRPFLTAEQYRQLFDWIDASFFQMEPKEYDSFVLCALKNPEVQHIYEKPLLASVLRMLLARGACNSGEARQAQPFFTGLRLFIFQRYGRRFPLKST